MPIQTISLHAPVLQQGDVPCCVSIAITTAMEMLNGTPQLSPLFNFYVARADPTVLVDITIEEGLVAASNPGVSSLALHDVPLTAAGAGQAPTTDALENAPAQRIDNIEAVSHDAEE